MSWHSTADYYTRINTLVAQRLGGHHSARLLLASVDFEDVRALQVAEDWAGAGELLAGHAAGLVAQGADVVALATNLMHKVAPAIESAIAVPLVHIGDAVAAAAGVGTVGVVGTRWVMEEPFYADRLASHGIGTVVPAAADRELVDRVVFDELVHGRVLASSRAEYTRVFEDLAERGAEAIVLACTEIQLLVGEQDSPVPLVDSLAAHCDRLVDLVLA